MHRLIESIPAKKSLDDINLSFQKIKSNAKESASLTISMTYNSALETKKTFSFGWQRMTKCCWNYKLLQQIGLKK